VAKGPIERVLDGIGQDPKLRARAKAAVLVTAAEKLPAAQRTFTLDGITITIESGPVFREMANGHGAFEVVLSATRDGKPLTLDNPFQFVNPPFKTEDGSEDPLGTVRRILCDAVLAVAK